MAEPASAAVAASALFSSMLSSRVSSPRSLTAQNSAERSVELVQELYWSLAREIQRLVDNKVYVSLRSLESLLNEVRLGLNFMKRMERAGKDEILDRWVFDILDMYMWLGRNALDLIAKIDRRSFRFSKYDSYKFLAKPSFETEFERLQEEMHQLNERSYAVAAVQER